MKIFGFLRKTEEGCCTESSTSEQMKAVVEARDCSGIKVLGGGCAKCHELEANTKAALEEMSLNEKVELITDFSIIASYGVMSTPALVIDDEVVSCGRILKKDEIIRLYKGVRG